jgi:hypothetical protein
METARSDDSVVRTTPACGRAVVVQGEGAFFSPPSLIRSSGDVSARGRQVRGGSPASTSLPADPETNRFRRRAVERVQRSKLWQTLNKTERRYATVLIGQLSNQGGEMYFKHDQLAELVGQCRRNVIRVLEALVSKGLLTVGARYRWVLKVSSRGRPYWMKMRLPNVYRLATRFMTALKQAGQLIRRRNVTAVKPSLRSGGKRSTTQPARRVPAAIQRDLERLRRDFWKLWRIGRCGVPPDQDYSRSRLRRARELSDLPAPWAFEAYVRNEGAEIVLSREWVLHQLRGGELSELVRL